MEKCSEQQMNTLRSKMACFGLIKLKLKRHCKLNPLIEIKSENGTGICLIGIDCKSNVFDILSYFGFTVANTDRSNIFKIQTSDLTIATMDVVEWTRRSQVSIDMDVTHFELCGPLLDLEL